MRPPCWQSDQWLREGNKRGSSAPATISPEDMRENYEATLRSQAICMTSCPRRQECLDEALSFGRDNDNYVFGGYTGAERAKLRNGELTGPDNFKAVIWDRLCDFMDGASMTEVADMHGVAYATLGTAFKNNIWSFRAQAGDLLKYGRSDLSEKRGGLAESYANPGDVGKPSSNVRAA